MSQSLADIILHVVFSTKERLPLIKIEIQEELYRYISEVCSNLSCPIISINGIEDHVHILLHLGRTIAISNLISEIKSSSSRWIKSKSHHFRDFNWQRGYGAFSVSRMNIENAKRYLASQKEHHKKISFKDEFLSMLKRAQIQYDEKYLWD